MTNPIKTPLEVTIRAADLDDRDDGAAVVTLLDAYATDPAGGGQALGASVRERMVPALRSHAGSLVLLAFAGGRAVGIAVCFFGISTFHARPLLNIHDLAVLPDSRAGGVGRALLREAEARARERDCCKLTLEVQDDNRRAQGLYESFGFGDFVLADSPVATRFLSKNLSKRA